MKSDKSISTKESGKTCSLTKLIDNQTNGLGLPDYIPINEVTSYFNTTVRELFDYTERLPLYGQFFSFFVHKDLPSKSVWVGRSIDKCFSLDAEATETEIFQIFEKFNFDISVLTPIPAEIVKDLKEHKECWIIVKPPTQKPNQAIILHHSRLFIRSADLLNFSKNFYGGDDLVSGKKIHGNTILNHEKIIRNLQTGILFLWNYFQEDRNNPRFQNKTEFFEKLTENHTDLFEFKTISKHFPDLPPLKKSHSK